MKFITQPIDRFVKLETSSSMLLLIFTVGAIIISNTGFSNDYNQWLHAPITIGVGDFQLSKDIIHWINDGLMAIFFFVIGLEVKREVMAGELSEFKKAILPVSAAIGGMIVPILFFFVLNKHPQTADGWAIPIAADIAFSLGILKLLGNRVPYGLKIFLTTFAVVDDLGAIVIIAIFYSPTIQWTYILVAFGILLGLLIFCRLRLYSKYFFFIAGIVVWFLFLKSGVHATIAGVLMAFVIPIHRKIKLNAFKTEVTQALNEFSEESLSLPKDNILDKNEIGLVDNIEDLAEKLQSPLQYLENKLHNWVVYFIMPIFAFANAGVTIEADKVSSLSWIIAISLLLGNSIGISLVSFIVVKLKIAELPEKVSMRHVYAMSILGGLGFTMSLFITNLAYSDQAIIDAAKIGIIIGSFFAGVLGYLALRHTLKKSI